MFRASPAFALRTGWIDSGMGQPPARCGVVCGGDPGGWLLAGVGCVHPRSLAPLQGAGVSGGRNRGCSLALDPRLISVTPTVVGRSGIGRSMRETVAVGVGGQRLRWTSLYGAFFHQPVVAVRTAARWCPASMVRCFRCGDIPSPRRLSHSSRNPPVILCAKRRSRGASTPIGVPGRLSQTPRFRIFAEQRTGS
jgi:hypothetical protein